jgi:hypothetical protein
MVQRLVQRMGSSDLLQRNRHKRSGRFKQRGNTQSGGYLSRTLGLMAHVITVPRTRD